MPDTITAITEGWKLSPKESEKENQDKGIKESQHSTARNSVEKKENAHTEMAGQETRAWDFFIVSVRETAFIW